MSQNLKLEVFLTAINKATGPLKAITKGSSETAKALKSARDNLRQLNDQQNNINGFRKLDKDIAITANSLNGATQRIKDLKREMATVETPTAAMSREFNKAVTQASKLKQEHAALIAKQQQLRTALNDSGLNTSKLAEHQRTLKQNLANATAQVDRQTTALKKQSEIASRMNQAKRMRDEGMQNRDKIAGAGASIAGAGVVAGLPILKAVRDFAQFETAMLGVARQMNGARDANGKLTKDYYDMGNAIKDMAERLPLTSVEIAQLVEGAGRMGIQGKNNLLLFTEQAAIMAAAFDLPTDQIAEDMGMISSLYKIPIKDMHEFGDAINYLDDNAQSKGGDIINVMKRMAGMATMVKMNFKDAAALGSTFLSLGASEEVAATASNAMIQRLANAPILSSAKSYAGGLKMLGLEAAILQKNMNGNATGTILDVLDRIKKLPSDKQLEAATRLFGVEYGDDASKLAQNLEEYRRQLKLTQELRAKGSMNKESTAKNESLDSQIEMAKSGIFNTSSEMGGYLKPALVDILVLIKSVTSGMRDWVKEHPILTAFILKAVAAVAILSIGVGGLLIAIAGIMGPMIAMRYAFTLMGIKGTLLGTALRFIGTSIMFIGRMLLMNPIGLAVTAIAVSALLIYKYWEPIKTFFSNLWDGITERFNKFIKPIKEALTAVGEWMGFGNNTPKLANAGGGGGITRATIKPIQPIIPRGRGGTNVITHAPVIHVNAAPGMSEAQLANAVGRELEKSNNAAAARSRSSLSDRD